MKKIIFLIACLIFSISVSAHQPTKSFNNQVASKGLIMESSQMHSSMYNSGNSGVLQLI